MTTKQLAVYIAIGLFVMAGSILVFGFLGPFLISQAATEAIILGVAVLIAWPVGVLLVAYSKFNKKVEKKS